MVPCSQSVDAPRHPGILASPPFPPAPRSAPPFHGDHESQPPGRESLLWEISPNPSLNNHPAHSLLVSKIWSLISLSKQDSKMLEIADPLFAVNQLSARDSPIHLLLRSIREGPAVPPPPTSSLFWPTLSSVGLLTNVNFIFFHTKRQFGCFMLCFLAPVPTMYHSIKGSTVRHNGSTSIPIITSEM